MRDAVDGSRLGDLDDDTDLQSQPFLADAENGGRDGVSRLGRFLLGQ